MIKVTLKDGKVLEVEKGKTILKQMKKPTPSYRGEYLIDYIK